MMQSQETVSANNRKANFEPGQLIPLLQATQEAEGYISEAAIQRISLETGIAEAEIFGVITFYKQFRLKPLGKYLIRVCDGTACHVNDSKTLIEIIQDMLKLDPSEDTTDDGMFTLQTVACIGCCSLAPVITVNDATYGRLTPQTLRKTIRKYQRESKKGGSN
jgi:NADH-quinone oxidoreductase subunit E